MSATIPSLHESVEDEPGPPNSRFRVVEQLDSGNGVAQMSEALIGRCAAASSELQAIIEEEFPDLDMSRRAIDMLAASMSENISTLLHALRLGIPRQIFILEDLPTDAVAWASQVWACRSRS